MNRDRQPRLFLKQTTNCSFEFERLLIRVSDWKFTSCVRNWRHGTLPMWNSRPIVIGVYSVKRTHRWRLISYFVCLRITMSLWQSSRIRRVDSELAKANRLCKSFGHEITNFLSLCSFLLHFVWWNLFYWYYCGNRCICCWFRIKIRIMSFWFG